MREGGDDVTTKGKVAKLRKELRAMLNGDNALLHLYEHVQSLGVAPADHRHHGAHAIQRGCQLNITQGSLNATSAALGNVQYSKVRAARSLLSTHTAVRIDATGLMPFFHLELKGSISHY